MQRTKHNKRQEKSQFNDVKQSSFCLVKLEQAEIKLTWNAIMYRSNTSSY